EGEYALGHTWTPLSPKYAAWKAIHFPGRPILQRTGALRRAASRPLRRATADGLTITIPWSRELGQPVKVEWHQEGTIGKVGPAGHTGTMPARPILFDPDDVPDARHDLEQAMDDYVEELLNRSGLT